MGCVCVVPVCVVCVWVCGQIMRGQTCSMRHACVHVRVYFCVFVSVRVLLIRPPKLKYVCMHYFQLWACMRACMNMCVCLRVIYLQRILIPHLTSNGAWCCGDPAWIMYVCVYLYVCTYVYNTIYVILCGSAYTSIHVPIHTYIHTYKYI
jgi:hypothetical protein